MASLEEGLATQIFSNITELQSIIDIFGNAQLKSQTDPILKTLLVKLETLVASPNATARSQTTSLAGLYDDKRTVPEPVLTPPKESDTPENYVRVPSKITVEKLKKELQIEAHWKSARV
jgi:hypothetical protein